MAVNRIALVAALALAAAAFSSQPLSAGQIERACTSSPRASGDRRLCGCIQQVADQLLTRRDQKLAASFFADPHRAQETRMSDRSRDERFWKRYTRFGQQAQRACR